ncbi:MAG TPA: NAD(P)H-dependent oxidoreductase [Trebonia sp.]|nr:NAD(P)H-dependent oxidoreductase [Trebonia sp.]
MTLFRLDASINPDGSASRAIGDIVENEWAAVHPGEHVVRRNVGTDPFQSTAWTKALHATAAPEGKRSRAQHLTIEMVCDLAAELREADAALLTVPLYNWGLPAHVKTWIDLVFAGAKSSEEALLDGKPAVLVVVRGGAYGEGMPREGWDYASGYLRRIIADVWGAQLTVVERELTLVGVDPALDDFAELAVEMKDAAFAAAREAGRSFAQA